MSRWTIANSVPIARIGRLRWVALWLAAGLLPAITGAESPDPEDPFTRHIAHLKTKLPSDEFLIRVEKPFVVIGDEQEAMLQQRCRSIRWAVDRLKKQYFTHDPEFIIDIWLFRDKQSYQSHVPLLFQEQPGTPFGYYSAQHRALIMNISTGGGTLVHEIVHPLMERNFVHCPAWFNEGLASLYEQSGERDGAIVGFTNWRLAGLQRAIAAKQLPDFRRLCETTTHEFYREDPGTNYAQARYLCFYLQEKGLLQRFYRRFLEQVEEDPSGYKTLLQILGDPSLDEFQAQWQDSIMKLRFP